MHELLNRLKARPIVTAELLVGSFLINVLALASSLFVMQVLNRYVAQGVDSTLLTLTTGVILAIVLEFLFRQTRMKLARGISAGPDEAFALAGFNILTRAKMQAYEQLPPEVRREMLGAAGSVESAYSASNITSVLDVPFALIFVFVLYLLHPILAGICVAFIVAVFAAGAVGSIVVKDKTAEAQQVSSIGSTLLSTAGKEGDSVRAFNAGAFLRRAFSKNLFEGQTIRRVIGHYQGLLQTVTQSANSLMSVAIIAIGAILAVTGEMDVGAMIGANILASRALQPISKFSQLGAAFAKARQAIELFKKVSKIPLEAETGSALRTYAGGLEFRDVAFAFPGNPTPLFESLSLKIAPGSVVVVTGANGAGKTTLARLVMGLLEPARGQVLADGLDLKQVAPEWWRRQVIFLPQEPALFNATILENLTMNKPDIDMAELNRIVDAVGLRKYLDESANGFDTPIVDNGWRLSEGIRRRIALARALTTGGMLALIDEPTESLDAEGCAAVHAVLGSLAKAGRTIIVMSHDPNIVKGPHTVIDLNVKPEPKVIVSAPPAPPSSTATPSPATTAPASPAAMPAVPSIATADGKSPDDRRKKRLVQ